MKKVLPILFLSFLFIVSCTTTGVTTKVETTQKTVTEVLKYQGPKARIAVARFDCKAAKCYGRIGDGVRDMLIDALVKSGRFIVLERGEGLSTLKEELNLAESGYVQKEKAAKKGTWEGADIIVTGSIIAFEPKAEGVGGGIGVMLRGIPLIGGVKLEKGDAFIAANIRLIDVRTGRIINSTVVEGKASSFGVKGITLGIVGIPLATGLSMYKNTPMEKAVMVMLNDAVEKISQLVPENYYRYKQ